MQKALGIDIGGTKILYSVLDKDGNILSEIKKTSTPKTAEEIVSVLKSIIKEHYNNIDVIGLSSAGAVNLENTMVLSSTPNLPAGYNSIDFSKLSDKKVFVENDADAAAWAEHIIGASKGMAYSVMLTLGTGVGGGIILDNKLYKVPFEFIK